MKQPTLTVGVAHGNRRSSNGHIRPHPTAIRDHWGRFPDKPRRDTVDAGHDPVWARAPRLGKILRITTRLGGREVEVGYARSAALSLGRLCLAAQVSPLGLGAPATAAGLLRRLSHTGSQGRRLLPTDLARSFDANEEGPAHGLEGQERRNGHQQNPNRADPPHTFNIPTRSPLDRGKSSTALRGVRARARLVPHPKGGFISDGLRGIASLRRLQGVESVRCVTVEKLPRRAIESSHPPGGAPSSRSVTILVGGPHPPIPLAKVTPTSRPCLPLPLSRPFRRRIIHRVRARRGVSGALYPEPAIPGLKTARGPSGRWTTGRTCRC